MPCTWPASSIPRMAHGPLSSKPEVKPEHHQCDTYTHHKHTHIINFVVVVLLFSELPCLETNMCSHQQLPQGSLSIWVYQPRRKGLSIIGINAKGLEDSKAIRELALHPANLCLISSNSNGSPSQATNNS